jgi:predicted transcriptional regulator
MATLRSDVTDAELSVLKALWDDGPRTIRQITERLYPEGGTAHYATVQKLLERLRAKGCVEREAQGRGHVYRAGVARDDLIARRLRDTADRLCEGSLTPLLTHLAGATRLSREELETLRHIVERGARRGTRGTRGKEDDR